MLRVLDLFSGIGGFSLGLERAGGFETVAFCEIDPVCRRVLEKHWPGVPIFEDIRTLRGEDLGPIDIISGGFPCQDISAASSTGAGIEGERSGLWTEMFRLISDLRPRYAIMENSPALLWRGFGKLLGDLASIRYDAEWHCIPASALGAPFEGDRIYILATPHTLDGQEGMGFQRPVIRPGSIQAANQENRSTIWVETACRSARMGDGFSDYVDRRERTEGLGNAVVPQVVELIGRAILAAERCGEGRSVA